ncbi:MAG: pseudaminic acid synthase [Alphaproteobacteria bacterium]|nr:pseudaminic acid synthase [Alphaproteobacteria bacterium]
MVAELSANHGGDFKRALKIIRAAAEAGADAVKFQAYTADSLTLDVDLPDFQVTGDSPWTGQKLHDLYAEAATPYEWFPGMFAECKKLGVIPFASPFDQAAIDMLQALEAPAYKIASFEAVDLGLIEACAKTGKPLIISVGLCDEDEITDAVNTARGAGAEDIILLQCNSAYPSQHSDANLRTIPFLIERYGVLVGYSDHTLGGLSSAAACALGACIIEKHIIDEPQPKTADSSFSLTPDVLKTVIDDCRAAWRSRGEIRQGPTESEKGSLAFRRSLYVVRDLRAGDIISSSVIRSIRPGYGLAPKHLNDVLGRPCTRDISRGEAVDWTMITSTPEK